ncbi:MAG: class I SAM-dependent methyltransferase [archaeon]
MERDANQRITKDTDSQKYYYESIWGKLLGSKVREKLILDQIKTLKKNQTFLEVGCAQGYYLSKAIERSNNIFGIDIIEDFVKAAKQTGAKVKIGSATKLQFKNNSMDFVLCTETLEHISDWEIAVDEIKRVLKKNGKAIITIPLEKSLFWRIGSIIFPPERTRGHVSLLYANQIKDAFYPLKLVEQKFIQTPCNTLNKILPQNEKISMYSFFVFKK